MLNPEFIPVYVLLLLLLIALYLTHKELVAVKTFVTPLPPTPMPTPEEMVESLQVAEEE